MKMMDKKQMFETLERKKQQYFDAVDRIWEHPETSFEEYFAADLLCGLLEKEGFETFTLSTESCDICEQCAYPQGKPCRHPERMHPCLESHGIVASEIVESEKMEYNLGGNTILWFSMILFRA